MQCRACLSSRVQSIIPLGQLPLANALIKKKQVMEHKWNLEVMLCQACGLAQLKDIVDPKSLFSEYVYFSSNSDTMLASAKACVESLAPKQDDFVVEIASNDGYLLKNYVEKHIRVLGIDPASNIAKYANEQGVPTLCDFFGKTLAEQVANEHGKANIIHANNVFAHVPDIIGFVQGLKILLASGGQCVIEVPYFLSLVNHLEFDTIYHEHVYYFSVKPLRTLFRAHGLEIFNIEEIPIHGGSLRLFIGHTDEHQSQPIVNRMVEHEIEQGLYELKTYQVFMGKLNNLKAKLKSTLSQYKSEGHKLAAYGASAKGTTLLNFTGIGDDLLDFVVDRSPAKQGLYTPGTGLEILTTDELRKQKIDYALLLAWNFSDEILSQQKDFIAQQGKFIIPLPEVKVVS